MHTSVAKNNTHGEIYLHNDKKNFSNERRLNLEDIFKKSTLTKIK
jgi:hypothetical protein